MTIVLPEWAFTFLILILAIIVHEIGHWIIPQCKGMNPKLMIGFIIIAVTFDIKKSTPIQMLIDISLFGVILGLIPIVILGNASNLFLLLIVYFFLCSVDVLKIVFMTINARRNDAYFWGEISS